MNEGSALLFSAAIAIIAALHFWTKISRVLLFWAAFILIAILVIPQRAGVHPGAAEL